jgi:xanthine dehydrogenase YagS FAD-binding subunit
MKPFTYLSAANEAEAVRLLGAGRLALAGGTSLLNLMKEHVVEPESLVNIKSIQGLDRASPVGEGLLVGANMTLTSLLENKDVEARYPALWQALETVATPQIRNVATLGGNLCARPPCWYLSHENFACAKRGNANTCPAREGENEFSAIFQTDGPCVAVHASSLAPALLALGASVRIVGPEGARELPLEKFFLLPKDNVLRENVLGSQEIVTHVILGPGKPKSATYVVNPKASHDWPVALASVALDMSGETVSRARIVLGAVAPIPWRALDAEGSIAGQKVTPETAARAGESAVSRAEPLAQNGYKIQIAKTAVKRALLVAAHGQWR